MVWGGISLNAKTDLVFGENGSLTVLHYIQEILAEYVLPLAPFIGDDFLLMHDNAHSRVAQ